ncbi:hypothetical protein KY314_02890 [Candidatus Woesearchaeota archaeon]|nr:hypothetical protein [Candidatus Woesearchaeota archaeon]
MSKKSLPPYTIEKVFTKDGNVKYVSVYNNENVQERYEKGLLGKGFDTAVEAYKNMFEFESYLV